MTSGESKTHDITRMIALAVTAAGAAGSLLLMFHAPMHPPFFLVILFTGWVLSPFVALIAAEMLAPRWPAAVRVTLYTLAFAIVAGSLAMYDGIIPMPEGSKPAAVFVMVPLIAWLLVATVLPLAALRSRRER